MLFRAFRESACSFLRLLFGNCLLPPALETWSCRSQQNTVRDRFIIGEEGFSWASAPFVKVYGEGDSEPSENWQPHYCLRSAGSFRAPAGA